jgi:hypothetical protein
MRRYVIASLVRQNPSQPDPKCPLHSVVELTEILRAARTISAFVDEEAHALASSLRTSSSSLFVVSCWLGKGKAVVRWSR